MRSNKHYRHPILRKCLRLSAQKEMDDAAIA
jgi:hypothetical protein